LYPPNFFQTFFKKVEIFSSNHRISVEKQEKKDIHHTIEEKSENT